MAWLVELAQRSAFVAGISFVAVRAIAVVIPPIPGAVLDIPAVQVFGWKVAFILSEAGTMLGALIAFAIGRRIRGSGIGRLAGRVFRIKKVREWEQQLPPKDQFLAWVALRLPSNAAFDYISYAAGLTECSLQMFFWSTLVGNVPVVLVFFYISGLGFEYNVLVGWVAPLAFLGIFSIPVTLHLRRKLTRSNRME